MDAPVRPCSDIDNITDEKARTQDLGSFVAMAVMGDDPFGSFSIRDEKVEAVDLLEVCWFFENLLERRKMMSRCYSDPCTSSDFCQEMMVRNSYANDRSPPEKLPEGDDCVGHTSPSLPCLGRREATQEEGPGSGPSKSTQNHLLGSPSLPPSVERREGEIQVKDVDLVQPNLLRAPSLAPCVGRKEGAVQEGEIGLGTGKLTQKSSQRGLLRAPSMPPCVGREGLIQYKERDPRSSKLTRTTSLSPPDILPRRHTSKGLAQNYGTPRHRLLRKQEEGTMSMNVAKEMRRRYLNQTNVIRKSLSDLEYEEVQGFKDLGFTFEKEDLSPSVVNILPGLQVKDRGGPMEEDSVRRPYLSEAWIEQCSAPPIPNWVGKSSAQDMKAQIKFWARAVASNVHQEC